MPRGVLSVIGFQTQAGFTNAARSDDSLLSGAISVGVISTMGVASVFQVVRYGLLQTLPGRRCPQRPREDFFAMANP